MHLNKVNQASSGIKPVTLHFTIELVLNALLKRTERIQFHSPAGATIDWGENRGLPVSIQASTMGKLTRSPAAYHHPPFMVHTRKKNGTLPDISLTLCIVGHE